MPRRANTQTQQEAVQENAAVQANTGADMQMEAAITKTQPEKGVLALADVKIGDFMTIRNVRIKEDDYGLTVATVYKGNIIKNLIMDCQSYTKYRPNETTGGIFVSWRRKEELPTGA